jgi:hypothetical protein
MQGRGGAEIAFANDLGKQRAFSLKSLPKSNGVKDGVKKGGNFKNPETRQSTIRYGGSRLPTMEFSNANVTGNLEFVEPAGRQRGNVYGMKARPVSGGMRCRCMMKRGGVLASEDDPLPPLPARTFDRVKDATMVADKRRKALKRSRMSRFIDLQRLVEHMERIGDVGSSDYTDAKNEITRLRGLIGGALDEDMVIAEKQRASPPSQGSGLISSLASLAGLGKIPKGFHMMPDGTIMKDSDHTGSGLISSLASAIGLGKKPRKQTQAMKKGTQALMAYQAKLKKLKSQGMTHKEAQQALRDMKD